MARKSNTSAGTKSGTPKTQSSGKSKKTPARRPSPDKQGAKSGGKGKALVKKLKLTADNADRHILYEASVQNVETEIDFVDATFEKIRGRRASLLREDFCGTGNTSCEWVRRRKSNRAIGLDLDRPTLDWGLDHHVASLNDEQKSRVDLRESNVLTPGDATNVDCVLAMNFSYWILDTREQLRGYFEAVRESLADDGVFFLDFYGGYESMKETKEKREIELEPESPYGKAKFTYVWHQARYEPISGRMECKIHFNFRDGTKFKNAFEYTWRLWTLPEIRELLVEAGFKNVTVYWEGDDGDGGGDGEFEPVATGEADPAFICYITAAK